MRKAVNRRRTTRVLQALACCAAIALASSAASAADVTLFPFAKDLTQPEPGDSAAGVPKKVGLFVLDEEIFAATDGSYANLRIVDAENKEVPVLVRCRRQNKRAVRDRAVAVETTGMEKMPDNRIRVTVGRKDADRAPDAVVFVTNCRNYEKQVSVYGSRDRESWELLAEDRPIFDYTRFMDVRNSRVDFKPGAFAWYRLEISNITESRRSPLVSIVRETQSGSLSRELEKTGLVQEDFRIEKLEFLQKEETVVESERVTRPYVARNMGVASDPKTKKTTVSFEASSAPLTALAVKTGSCNFSRAVEVEATNGGDEKAAWQKVASSTISRIDAGKFQQSLTTVNLNQVCRFERYRIVINNMDCQPLDISGVDAEGEVHEALFFCDAGKKYRALYGAKGMEAPKYDIAAVLGGIGEVDTGIYAAGPQKANSLYAAAGRKGCHGTRQLLAVAVLAAVAALVWLIARTTRRVEQAV